MKKQQKRNLVPMMTAKLIDKDESITGYYMRTTLRATDMPTCLADCRIFDLIVKDGDYFYIDIETMEYKKDEKEHTEFENLLHYKDTTISLWATDRPDLIKDKTNFWKLEY